MGFVTIQINGNKQVLGFINLINAYNIYKRAKF